MSYNVLATQQTPALIIYLLDISGSMMLPMGEKRRIDIVMDSLATTFKQMVFRSTKGSRLIPRYRLAMLAYSDHVYDLLDGVQGIDKVAKLGVPELSPQRFTDTAKAFQQAERILERELKHMQDCPAPLICHMTDGASTGADPEPIAQRIMQMSVPDGHVLIENIFISDKILENPISDPKRWSGVTDDTIFRDEHAAKLRNMSSKIPDSYLEMMEESTFRLDKGSYMMLPGTSPELISLGFQMSAATPIR